jgi:hypothetical protein
MKPIKYILILLLLFGIHTINAQQEYKRCLDGEVIKWSLIYDIADRGLVSEEIIAYGDTTINGNVYKYIKGYNFGDFEESNANWKNHIPDISHSGGIYFIRESDDASRLYFLDNLRNKEYLISDLNLQVGDEFQEPDGNSFWTVDSVYTKNGLKHIRFDCSLDFSFDLIDKLTFIEGIGINLGPLVVHSGGLLNCFQNQSMFYKNESVPYPCGYEDRGFIGIETVFFNKDYSLLRKDEGIVIDFLSEESRQISICDISGRMHYSKDFSAAKEVLIPTGSFPKGIYLLKIFNKKNNRISINKIIL